VKEEHGTDKLFARGDRGNDGQDVKQNFKSTVGIKRLRGLQWCRRIQFNNPIINLLLSILVGGKKKAAGRIIHDGSVVHRGEDCQAGAPDQQGHGHRPAEQEGVEDSGHRQQHRVATRWTIWRRRSSSP
jgi:hypothetical protein